MKQRGTLLLAGLLWLSGIVVGLRALWSYQTTPGAAGAPPAEWPAESPLARTPGRSTLLLLAHPRCPCSRASIDELAWIMARAGDKVTTHVLLVQPDGLPEDWTQGDLWRNARSIPGTRVTRDAGGVTARLFGAVTSGQTILYDPSGRMRFNGGITGMRGHQGWNPGRAGILSLLSGAAAPTDRTPVFGCSLTDAGAGAGR